MDRLEEKRKIKAQAFHERKVLCLCHVNNLRKLTILYSSLLSSCVKRPLRTPPSLLKTSYSWATRRFHSVAFRSYCPLPIMIHCHELIPCICYCPPMRILRGRYMNMTRFGCCDEPFVRRSVICTTQLSNESTLVADVMQNVFGMPPTPFANPAGPP